MNEQIRLLAEQAGMYVDVKGEPWPRWMGAEECEAAYARFAELIVQECIWAFGETRTEPSLEKYILDRLGINHGTENSRT